MNQIRRLKQPIRNQRTVPRSLQKEVHEALCDLLQEGAHSDTGHHAHFVEGLANWVCFVVSALSQRETFELLGLVLRYVMELPHLRIAIGEFERVKHTLEGKHWMRAATKMRSRNPMMTLEEALAFNAPPRLHGDSRTFSSLLERAFMQEQACDCLATRPLGRPRRR
jgi:hypothetical protein